MNGTESTVVVVGGGLGGFRTVEALRRVGHQGELVLVGAEPHLPYDRPPLSKEVLRGTRTPADIRLGDDGFFAEHKVILRLGTRAVELDPRRRTVTLDDGDVLGYGHLVVATGLTPRELPGTRGLAGVHRLRSLDDCLALRTDLARASRVVIVGAGFIGCEVAASLRELEIPVTLVEPRATPLAAVLGETVGGLVARLHVDAGVDVRCGVGVERVLGTGRCTGVVLTDGTEIAADVVVVGIGSVPETGWLAGSGLAVGNGVLCDGSGRTSADGVWAVGDAAAWGTPDGEHHRVEHWSTVGEQARVVAETIHGAAGAPRSVPYFWTDQYGLRTQVFGHISPADTVDVVSDDGRRFVATYSRDGVTTGVIGAGMAGAVARLRRTLLQPTRAA